MAPKAVTLTLPLGSLAVSPVFAPPAVGVPTLSLLFLLRGGNSLRKQVLEIAENPARGRPGQGLHTQIAKLSHSHCATEKTCFVETNGNRAYSYSYACATSPHP